MAEELVLWASEPFGFVDLGDAFCTGSSIMPQKKNPDVAELVRGKTGRMVGHLVSLLVLMKGQPLAYNRDNQEDKEPVFDGVDTALACLDVLTPLVGQMKFDEDKMRQAAERVMRQQPIWRTIWFARGYPFAMLMRLSAGQLRQHRRRVLILPISHSSRCVSSANTSTTMYSMC
ncbi:MAG: hypothetical protein Ct9H300mP16_11470 [Pseudomonadota bacterium]|nr:MAG: hypothetical protein Ct9H300mP16_11470 [Pseudomonadota bacterium]